MIVLLPQDHDMYIYIYINNNDFYYTDIYIITKKKKKKKGMDDCVYNI